MSSPPPSATTTRCTTTGRRPAPPAIPTWSRRRRSPIAIDRAGPGRGAVRPGARAGLRPRRARRPAVRPPPADRRRRRAVLRPCIIDAIRVLAGNDVLDAAHRDHRRRRATPVCTDLRHAGRPGAGVMSVRAFADVAVGDELPPLTLRFDPRPAGPLRRRLRRLQPDPLERARGARRSACPASSRTACSRWRWPAGSSPTGSGDPGRVRSTRPASPGRSSSPTTTSGADRRGHRRRRRAGSGRPDRAGRHHRDVQRADRARQGRAVVALD